MWGSLNCYVCSPTSCGGCGCGSVGAKIPEWGHWCQNMAEYYTRVWIFYRNVEIWKCKDLIFSRIWPGLIQILRTVCWEQRKKERNKQTVCIRSGQNMSRKNVFVDVWILLFPHCTIFTLQTLSPKGLIDDLFSIHCDTRDTNILYDCTTLKDLWNEFIQFIQLFVNNLNVTMCSHVSLISVLFCASSVLVCVLFWWIVDFTGHSQLKDTPAGKESFPAHDHCCKELWKKW